MRKSIIKIYTVLLITLLTGCATYWSAKNADTMMAEGKTKEALVVLQNLAEKSPQEYRLKYISTRDESTQKLLQKAKQAKDRNNQKEATFAYQEILSFDPENIAANQGLVQLKRDQDESVLFNNANTAIEKGDSKTASNLVKEILVENPDHAGALNIKNTMDTKQNRETLNEPALNDLLKKEITLQLRDASLQQALEIFSATSGINFILDRDVKTDIKTTIFAKKTSVENALNLILKTAQLNKKVLNDSTFLIYQDTDDKKRKYEELVTRNFYLTNTEPKKLQEMIKTLVNPRFTYIDEQMKMLAVRDNKEVIETIERMVEAYDIAEPEVLLDVEILEVNFTDLLNLGIKYPDQFSVSLSGASGKAGQLNGGEITNLNRNSFNLFFPDPLLVLNLKQNSSNTKTLANPRIRVTNNQKAKVLIGDKVPVITTTVNQTSSASTESVSYIDVGLKLDVIPQIHLNNEVTIDIALEVSNIAREIKSTTGLLAYQIGTRNASTILRLKDGETQVLAGLIKKDSIDSASHVPLLGKVPLLGRLFSDTTNNKSNSEIILLITPHIVRALATPTAHNMEYASGTLESVSLHPQRLMPSSKQNSSNQKITHMDGLSSNPSAPNPTAANSATPNPAPPVSVVPNAVGPSQAASAAEQTAIILNQPTIVAGEASPIIANQPIEVAAAPAASAIPEDPSTFKLSAIVPPEVALMKEFTISLNTNNIPVEAIEFDVVFDQPSVMLTKSKPNAKVSNFSAKQIANTIHVKASKLALQKEPLATLTFNAIQVPNGALNMSIQNVQLKNGANALPPVSVALPYQIIVFP